MPLRKLSCALRLQCLAVLLAAQAASAESPLPNLRVFPGYPGSIPTNAVLVAHARRGFQIDPAKVVLRTQQGEDVPSTLTPAADERGGFLVKPLAPLSHGTFYVLHTGFETVTMDVVMAGEPDTTPPSAITSPTTLVTFSSGDRVEGVFVEFPGPTDNVMPRDHLGFDIWVSKSPAEPDLDGKPTLMGTQGRLSDDGTMRVSLAPDSFCISALPSQDSGRFIVRIRARDAAGNLGPVSEPIVVQVEEVPKCPTPGAGDNGCSAASGLAPAAWVAVALWLRRRRRSLQDAARA